MTNKYRVVIVFETDAELTEKQVRTLVESCLPTGTDIELENEDGNFTYVTLNKLTHDEEIS